MTINERRQILGTSIGVAADTAALNLFMEYSDAIANQYVPVEKQIISESSGTLTLLGYQMKLEFAVIEHSEQVNSFLQVSNQIAMVFFLLGIFTLDSEGTIEFRRGVYRNIVRALNNTSFLQRNTSVKEIKQNRVGF